MTELHEWICSLAAFLASQRPTPGDGMGNGTSAGYGPNSPGAFAYFVPDSCSWRTCQGWLFGDSEAWSPTWPKSFTWDGAFAWQLPTWAPPTTESDFSSLLPTPTASDDGKTPEAHRAMKARLPGTPRTRITSLAVLARAGFRQPAGPLLPTPHANASTGAGRQGRDGGENLQTAVARIGASTAPPSSDGNDSSAPLPAQMTLGGD